MADIFVSYTKPDRQWAEWIGQRLQELGHTPHLHDWEPVTDIAAWMEARIEKADFMLCVVSQEYLGAAFSAWERRAAHWALTLGREDFLRVVAIEDCRYPVLLAPIRRCELYGLDEQAATEALVAYLKPSSPPAGRMAFPGVAKGPLVPFPA